MEDGVLIIIKASSCGACIHLTKSGFFDKLFEELEVFDVVMLELESPTGFDRDTEGHEILNIDPWYPSFKYMTTNTYQNLGSLSASELFERTKLYNGKIVEGSYVKTADYSQIPTVASMQKFCDDSSEALSLLSESSSKSKISKGPKPKYTRK